MIITNGRVLVQPEMNEESFAEIIENLEDNVKNFFDIDVKFEKVDKPFLQYKIPDELPWKNIKEALPQEQELKLMGIGSDDEVTVPYMVNKTIDYRFSVDEVNVKGDEMCDILSEISQLEIEKKKHMKRLGDLISEETEKLKMVAQLHRQGFETKEIRCTCILSFKEQVRRYYDANSDELIHTEDMTHEDQRTLFDIKGFDLDTADELQGFSIEAAEDIEDEINDTNEDSVDQDVQNEHSENASPIDMEKV